MEALSLHTGAPIVNCKDNTSYISVVEYKIFTPRVKHFWIPVCFLQWKFCNSSFVPKYEEYMFIPADNCTKLCSGPIISRGTKLMTGFSSYPISDTEHYKLMILHGSIVN